LIGRNGAGKTTLMRHISTLDKNNNILYINQLVDSSSEKVFDIVLNTHTSRLRQFNRINQLESNDFMSEEELEEYNQLMGNISFSDESKVRKILSGLGFSNQEQDRNIDEFSGGWRKRVAIAKALYIMPDLLLLDEPTNHLDLEAVIWLSDYLSHWQNTLIIVSHSSAFLNTICCHIMSIEEKLLTVYKGDYDSYLRQSKTKHDKIQKEWTKYQRELKGMMKRKNERNVIKAFIQTMESKGVVEPIKPYRVKFTFCHVPISHQLITIDNVSFGYPNRPLFTNMSMDIYADTRMALVGPNGVGKSTFFKLIFGDEVPSEGSVYRHNNLRIGYYNQHFAEDLDKDDRCAIDYIQSVCDISILDIRKLLGTSGLPGIFHKVALSSLSGGQRARVVLAKINAVQTNLLLMDEPTNHLDIESNTALIGGISAYNGAVMLISHDMELISKTNCKLFVIKPNTHTIAEYSGDFDDYMEEILQDN
jgi:ATP-binding cassette subfamily F protein 1